MLRRLRPLMGLAGFVLVWEAAVRVDWVERVFLPTPSDVAAQLTDLLGQASFLREVIATALAWLFALGIAAAVAIPAGLLLGSVPAARTATRALIEIVRPLPSVALVAPMVIVLGSGPETTITLAVFASVWPILFNTLYALDEIDPLLVDTARSFGAGRLRIVAAVALPHAMPFAVTGLRLSASIALIVVISTEYLAGSEHGLGAYLIDTATIVNAMDEVLAAAVVAGTLGFLANQGLERVARRMVRCSDTHAQVAR